MAAADVMSLFFAQRAAQPRPAGYEHEGRHFELAGRQTTEIGTRLGKVQVLQPIGECTDAAGEQARPFLEQASAPDEDGDILVIEVDGKGAPASSSQEHARRTRPRGAKAPNRRHGRRAKRRANPRPRWAPGKKSKNAKVAAARSTSASTRPSRAIAHCSSGCRTRRRSAAMARRSSPKSCSWPTAPR